MARMVTICIAVVALCLFFGITGKAFSEMPGEAGFKQNCAVCHPGGGNIINPKKTLHKKDLDANNVKTAGDIIKLMRQPGPGMTPFDASTVPDKEAKEIADYILKTFK
ncbi:MAG TPA: c-type cytochrome [Nitrospirota bacterium]|nr:c-type cytochrome [Nitrospirota bacterium]